LERVLKRIEERTSIEQLESVDSIDRRHRLHRSKQLLQDCLREKDLEPAVAERAKNKILDLEQRIEAEKASQEDKGSLLQDDELPSAYYSFRTLLMVGKVVSFVGWIIVVAGVGMLALGLVGEVVEDARSLAAASILTGAITAVAGLLVVGSGQTISCFVAIERNTRATQELLKHIGMGLKQVQPQASTAVG
jgi:hypothetical protein